MKWKNKPVENSGKNKRLRNVLRTLRKNANKEKKQRAHKEQTSSNFYESDDSVTESEEEEEFTEQEEDNANQDAEAPVNNKNELRIITREEWAAEKAREGLRIFRKPPELVRICSAGTPTCQGFKQCCAAMQDIQNRDFDEKLPDIKYSFVVSPDGLVFEGRSWKIIPEIRGQRYRSRCLLVAVIGEFLDIMPPKEALRSVGTLLTFGVKERHIDPQFKILPFQSFKIPKEDYRKGPSVSFSEFEDLVTEWERFD